MMLFTAGSVKCSIVVFVFTLTVEIVNVVMQAYEQQQSEKFGAGGTATDIEEGNVDNPTKRSICLYEAARCVIAAMTPNFDEISKVSSLLLISFARSSSCCVSSAWSSSSCADIAS